MPHCEDLVGPSGDKVRLIAPDLIGMGASDKLDNIEDPDRYSLAEQSKYFSAFLESVNVRERVTLVAHSWGGTRRRTGAANKTRKRIQMQFVVL